MQQQTEKLEELRATLAKEKQKAKRIWRQKCEQQLSHEEAIDEKDMEIAVRLKARLLEVTPSPSVYTSPGAPHSRKGADTQHPVVTPSTRESLAHRSIQC